MTNTMNTKSGKTKAKAPKLFPDELIDQLLSQVQNKEGESIVGESGPAGQLNKQLAGRTAAAERPPHHRGTSPKTVITPGGLPGPRSRQKATIATGA
jgi:hypothetical protein